MSEQFGQKARLRVRAEFDAVQGSGHRVSTRTFTLVACANALGRDRLGLIASRKVGGAVIRNRAKRRLRELFRRQVRTPGARSCDFVVIARSDLAHAPFASVRTDFAAAVQKARGRA